MIRLQNVTQHYGVRPILRNINLTIPAGKLTSIIGPNGMGKSTLIKVIAGLLSPQYGSVEIDGKIRRSSVHDELAIRKQVAYCPDKGWLPKSLSGREFVNQVAALYEIDDLRRMQHADSLFRVFELEDQADQSISNYSNGQKQKISICAALITDAPIMLMDEPFSNGLDPAGMLALKEILRHLVDNKHRTVLIATPIPELVEEISDLVAIVKEGELFAFGAIRDLRQQFGCDGTLSSILQTAIHPQSSQNIDEYVNTI